MDEKTLYCKNAHTVQSEPRDWITIPIKVPIAFFYRNRKNILKFICNHKRPQIKKQS